MYIGNCSANEIKMILLVQNVEYNFSIQSFFEKKSVDLTNN